MQFFYCELPLPRINPASHTACNQARYINLPEQLADRQASSGNVRLMRRMKDFDNSRFVLSGKLVDVCAALDELAAQEQHNTWRVAAQ
ncbi:MAG: hypothetical protein KA751_08475 [Comamonas sp.]|nr:hypothetical protein [Comamonas sp.]